jgi:uncharacterized protein (DUF305 family)
MSYRRFGAMVVTSFVLMYALMYLNSYRMAHVEFSQTRLWMALIMAATMALTMLAFMRSMYPNRTVNGAIGGAAIVILGVSLALVRTQETVGDVSYMKAMIPHHSIAVLTSTRAKIRDPRVRKLADGILETQVREIAEMDALISDLERAPPSADAPLLLAKDVGQ